MTSTRTALFPVFVDPPSSSTDRRTPSSASSFAARPGRPVLSSKFIDASTSSSPSSLSFAYASLSLTASSSTSKSSVASLPASSSSTCLKPSSTKLPSSSSSKPRKSSLAIFCDDDEQRETFKENVPLQAGGAAGAAAGEKKRKGLKELGVSQSIGGARSNAVGGGVKKRREVMRDVSAEFEDCRVADEPEGFRNICSQSSITPFEIFFDPTPPIIASSLASSASIPPRATNIKALSSKSNNQIPSISFVSTTPASKKPLQKAFTIYTSPSVQKLPPPSAAATTAALKPKQRAFGGLGGQGAARGLRG